MNIEAGPAYTSWQQRLEDAQARHKILVAQGKDSSIIDKHEPTHMALEEMLEEIRDMGPLEDEELEAKRRYALLKIVMARDKLTGEVGLLYPQSAGKVGGQKAAQAFEDFKESAGPTIINDNSVNYYPVGGSKSDREIGPRFDQY